MDLDTRYGLLFVTGDNHMPTPPSSFNLNRRRLVVHNYWIIEIFAAKFLASSNEKEKKTKNIENISFGKDNQWDCVL